MQRYLIQYFNHEDMGVGVLEDKLRYHMNSHKEYQRREGQISHQKPCSQPIIESYYLQKLCFSLEQKRAKFAAQRMDELGINKDAASKKRFRRDISNQG